MGSVIDALNAAHLPWAAISSEELAYAVRACLEGAYALNKQKSKLKALRRAYQLLAAYVFLASKRRNDTGKASVTSEEAAQYVPRFRGGVTLGVSRSYFDRTVRQELKQLGLVDYKEGKAKQTTVYTFPFTAFIAQGNEPGPLEQTASDEFQRECSQSTGFSSQALEQTTCEEFPNVGTNHVREVPLQEEEVRGIGIEEGYKNIPESPSYPKPQYPPQQARPVGDCYCLDCCSSQGIIEETVYQGGVPRRRLVCTYCGGAIEP